MQRINLYTTLLFALICFISCKSKTTEEEPVTQETVVQTPVTVTSVVPGPLIEYVELNATSAFLQSNIIKSSANGYIKSVNVLPGQFVAADKSIFSIQSKEAKNIGKIINNLDTTFRFSGITRLGGL